MVDISVSVERDNDLTVFEVHGDLTAADIISYSSEYYFKQPTKLVLWDATNGSVSSITNDEFHVIAREMKTYTNKRTGGKTALVSGHDIDFGLSRMYEAYADMEDLALQYRAFKDLDSARDWLLAK